MHKHGETIKLNVQGPLGGDLFLVVDYENKAVSLIEIRPAMFDGNKIGVLEVQSYTQEGS